MTRMLEQHPPRLRVKVRGDAAWRWVRVARGRVTTTTDERLAAELLGAPMAPILLAALEDTVEAWELVVQGQVVERG